MRKIIDMLVKKNIATYDEISGCSENEVMYLESLIHKELPRCYREFLLAMGHNAGQLFLGTDIFYKDLFGLREAAEELLIDNGNPFQLPSDAFVFSMHQGYEFLYFNVFDGDDPPVYQYVEGDNAPTRPWSSFSNFLKDSIEQHAKFISASATDTSH